MGWDGMVRYGMAWHGMVWYGAAWYGRGMGWDGKEGRRDTPLLDCRGNHHPLPTHAAEWAARAHYRCLCCSLCGPCPLCDCSARSLSSCSERFRENRRPVRPEAEPGERRGALTCAFGSFMQLCAACQHLLVRFLCGASLRRAACSIHPG